MFGAVGTAAYSWEFTLLRRPVGTGKARVAGRLVIEAPNACAARTRAMRELADRAGDEGERWSLGVLKPLTPRAPGTQLFRVRFAIWEARGDEFVRRDVHLAEIWAEDANAARRIGQQEIQAHPDYVPAWRIRKVSAATPDARRRRRR